MILNIFCVSKNIYIFFVFLFLFLTFPVSMCYTLWLSIVLQLLGVLLWVFPVFFSPCFSVLDDRVELS